MVNSIYVKFRSSTIKEYKASNYIAKQDEICYIKDKRKFVLGDGVTPVLKCKRLKHFPEIIHIDRVNHLITAAKSLPVNSNRELV